MLLPTFEVLNNSVTREMLVLCVIKDEHINNGMAKTRDLPENVSLPHTTLCRNSYAGWAETERRQTSEDRPVWTVAHTNLFAGPRQHTYRNHWECLIQDLSRPGNMHT